MSDCLLMRTLLPTLALFLFYNQSRCLVKVNQIGTRCSDQVVFHIIFFCCQRSICFFVVLFPTRTCSLRSDFSSFLRRIERNSTLRLRHVFHTRACAVQYDILKLHEHAHMQRCQSIEEYSNHGSKRDAFGEFPIVLYTDQMIQKMKSK